MKKSIYIAIASVLSVTAMFSIFVKTTSNQNYSDPTLNAKANDGSSLPAVRITEISADPLQIEFASLQSADAVVRDTSDVFEFVEIHNYSTLPLNLKDYALGHTVGAKSYQNEFLFEEGNDGVIESGETWVIFNYNTSSASYGSASGTTYTMRHDTAENLAAAWATFNEFYGLSLRL